MSDAAGPASRPRAKVVVRRARPDEIAACAALYERVLRETFTWQDPQQHQAADFLRDAQTEEVYVAVDDRGLAGIAAFYRPGNFIHSLYVDRRGQGVGVALLEHLEQVADGPLSLKVQKPNRRAQAFYAREGFRVVSEGGDPPPGVEWLKLLRDQKR